MRTTSFRLAPCNEAVGKTGNAASVTAAIEVVETEEVVVTTDFEKTPFDKIPKVTRIAIPRTIAVVRLIEVLRARKEFSFTVLVGLREGGISGSIFGAPSPYACEVTCVIAECN